MKGDFKTRKAIGSSAHTIREIVKMPSVMPTGMVRQWVLSFGQFGAGANHWLWSTTNVHGHGDLEFRRWNGGQIQSIAGGTHDHIMKAESLTRSSILIIELKGAPLATKWGALCWCLTPAGRPPR